MTAKERTQQLLLEIANTHSELPWSRQYSSGDFQLHLESYGISLATEAVEATLHDLINMGALVYAVTDDIRYRITEYGSALVCEMHKMALADAETA